MKMRSGALAIVATVLLMVGGTASADAVTSDVDPESASTIAVRAADQAASQGSGPGRQQTQQPPGDAKKTEVEVSLPSDTTSPVEITSAGKRISMSLPDVKVRKAHQARNGSVVRDGVKTDLVIHRSSQATKVMTVLADESAPTAYQYCLQGARLAALPGVDGAVGIFHGVSQQSSGPAVSALHAIISKPWAVDASGRNLPTRYSINGECFTQTVDTKGATFPVVADPSIEMVQWLPPIWIVTLNAKDQRILVSSGGAAFGAAVGALLCSGSTPVGAASCAALGALVATAATEIIKEYGIKEGCNLHVVVGLIGVQNAYRSGTC
ncbi:MAG: hypothetical protein QG622_2669 [Actinomycetota bacterium]|nr:hypothetical protein [Actinomycetota bacterium]